MLRNPAYAGIYAYGRSTLDPRRRQPGRPCTGRVRVGRDGWLVYLPGVLPAYISIEQYERNMARLDANRSRAGSLGAVRDGPALLAGLVACGRCGKKMTVRYQRGRGGCCRPRCLHMVWQRLMPAFRRADDDGAWVVRVRGCWGCSC